MRNGALETWAWDQHLDEREGASERLCEIMDGFTLFFFFFLFFVVGMV